MLGFIWIISVISKKCLSGSDSLEKDSAIAKNCSVKISNEIIRLLAHAQQSLNDKGNVINLSIRSEY